MTKLRKSFCLALVAISIVTAEDKPQVDLKPLKFGGSQEFGMISQMLLTSSPVQIVNNDWLDHFGAYFLQEATVDNTVDLSIGLGGVFQFPKPETIGERFGGSQYKLFYVGPAVAQAFYKFGDPKNPRVTLGGGMFPYKYNSDAVNLGEYLFRAAPYPSYILTGGLNVINDNAAYLEGFKAGFNFGDFKFDILLPTETGMPPFYDWSLAVVGNYKSQNGIIELGAGVNFNRLLQVRPSRTSREEIGNSYITKNGVNYTGDVSYYNEAATFYNAKGDSTTAKLWSSKADSVNSWKDSSGLIPGASYYTFAGTMLMAHGTLALNKLFNINGLSDKDLNLYFEASLLGLKNYPVFYESAMNRLPIMVGFNLPTFKLLDIFAAQVEYFNSKFINSTYSLGQLNHAVPYIPSGTSNIFSETDYMDVSKKDNISWSFLATKSIYHTFSISAQVARDHMRTVGTNWFYGSRQEPNEILSTSKDWYWMLQFGWKI